jgi:hypothetical protein
MMMYRCYNPKCPGYKYYGGRGIKVSKTFQDISYFIQYLEKLPGYKKGMSIDRINNNKDYKEGNIRWATKKEQIKNRRILSTNKSGFTGVSFNKRSNKWRAYLYNNNKMIHIGFANTSHKANLLRNNYIKQKTLS